MLSFVLENCPWAAGETLAPPSWASQGKNTSSSPPPKKKKTTDEKKKTQMSSAILHTTYIHQFIKMTVQQAACHLAICPMHLRVSAYILDQAQG